MCTGKYGKRDGLAVICVLQNDMIGILHKRKVFAIAEIAVAAVPDLIEQNRSVLVWFYSDLPAVRRKTAVV